MSNSKMAGIQSNLFEELDDADLMAVVGGNLLSDVGATVTEPGNDSQPTTTLVKVVAGYLGGPGAGFLEGVLQGTNKTVTGITG